MKNILVATDASPASNRAVSLAADLAASTKTWNIVYTHEPPVTRDPFGIDRQENADVRDHMLETAVEAGADLFIAGAVHSMQRYLPITDVVPTLTWETCAEGFGTTLFYPGTGTWTRQPSEPIPETLTAPMETYVPETQIFLPDDTLLDTMN